MPTGNLSLDILLGKIEEDALSGKTNSITEIKNRFPSLSDRELLDFHKMVIGAFSEKESTRVSIVATAPPSFGIKAKSTLNTVTELLNNASSSILITSYSLSDYFNDMIDVIVKKSQSGVLVKFYVNQIEDQSNYEKICRYKSRFLRIYNYLPSKDKMAALHAKVISVDQKKTLITSANLSYHGQQGNVELGTLIESDTVARQVEELFTNLLFKKVFVEI